jgi:hypothetical protein
MRSSKRLVILLAGVLTAVPLLAYTEPTPDELEENRQRLKRWHAAPEQYARLLQSYRDFLALPPDARQRLRKLDYDLHQEKPSTQARLFDVMERYADWLASLPADERKQIQASRDRNERLQLIRQIRERQWVGRQPLALRQQLRRGAIAPAVYASSAGLMGPAVGPGSFFGVSAALLEKSRAIMLGQMRRREKQRRQEWKTAFKSWDELTRPRPPFTLAQLQTNQPTVHSFVSEYLLPRLSKDEQKRLNEVAARPFLFPRTLVELADKHPSALPGPSGPTHFNELPKAVQAQLKPLMDRLVAVPEGQNKPIQRLKSLLKRAEGHWPQYGTAIAAAAKFRNIRLPYELWPSQKSDLSIDVEKFLEQKLLPELTEAEKKSVEKKNRSWPAFPLRLEELARRHSLHVPWLTLPGPRERWDVYRAPRPPVVAQTLPPLPRHTLRQFAALELTEQDRARLGLNQPHPPSWERLKAEYFKRKPKELERLKKAEKAKNKPPRQKKKKST